MSKTFKRSLVIEFVGPSGAGKTSCCVYFSQYLDAYGIRTATANDVKAYYKNMRVIMHLVLIIKTCFSKYNLIIRYLFFLLKNGICSSSSIYRYIRLAVLDTALNKYVKDNSIDIVLLDQWIIQGIWSATIFKNKSFGVDEIWRCYFPVSAVFYFQIRDEIAQERILQRKSNHSRFDCMQPTKVVEAQHKYNPYLYNLYEISKCSFKYQLSSERALSENAGVFFNYLKDSLLKPVCY